MSELDQIFYGMAAEDMRIACVEALRACLKDQGRPGVIFDRTSWYRALLVVRGVSEGTLRKHTSSWPDFRRTGRWLPTYDLLALEVLHGLERAGQILPFGAERYVLTESGAALL